MTFLPQRSLYLRNHKIYTEDIKRETDFLPSRGHRRKLLLILLRLLLYLFLWFPEIIKETNENIELLIIIIICTAIIMKIFCKLLRKEFLCQKFAINILSELKLTTRAPTIDLKPVNRTMEKIRHKNCLTQIHQETLRHVSPWVQVKVQSDIDVRVRVCNVHQYPDGNVFIAELHGPFKSNCAANMTVHTSSSGQLIDVVVKELKKDSNFHCELIVPVKASLCLHTQQDAMVENLFGKELTVKASRVIDVTDVRSDDINLETFNGDINCRGIFLANEAVLQATGLGVNSVFRNCALPNH